MFKTDKVVNGYLPTYLGILAQLPSDAVICELGVDDGYSLEMWQTLMPSALIIGVDNGEHAVWPWGTVRISMSQDDEKLPGRIVGYMPPHGIDLLIDDASHEADKTSMSFHHLWPLVAPGGFYVIEDWGVGFDSWPQAGAGMLRLAQSMLNFLGPKDLSLAREDVDSICYRRGLIILRKK